MSECRASNGLEELLFCFCVILALEECAAAWVGRNTIGVNVSTDATFDSVALYTLYGGTFALGLLRLFALCAKPRGGSSLRNPEQTFSRHHLTPWMPLFPQAPGVLGRRRKKPSVVRACVAEAWPEPRLYHRVSLQQVRVSHRPTGRCLGGAAAARVCYVNWKTRHTRETGWRIDQKLRWWYRVER